MSNKTVDCQYLKNTSCTAITSNDEAQEVRKINCNNDNEQACCYLCSFQEDCEISCDFIGEKKEETKNKAALAEKVTLQRTLRCPICQSKMLHMTAKLRIGGWSGLMQLAPFGEWSEIAEETLPVIVHVCPKCGKLEFVAQENTLQKVINRS